VRTFLLTTITLAVIGTLQSIPYAVAQFVPRVNVPQVRVNVPTPRVNVPQVRVNTPTVRVNTPTARVNTPQVREVHQDTPRVRAVHEDAPRVRAVHEDAPRVRAVHEDAPRVRAVREDAPRVRAVHEDTPRVRAVREDAPRVRAVHEDTPRVRAVREDTPRVRAVREDAPRVRAVHEDGPRVRAVHEDAPRGRVKTEVQHQPEKAFAKSEGMATRKPNLEKSPKANSGTGANRASNTVRTQSIRSSASNASGSGSGAGSNSNGGNGTGSGTGAGGNNGKNYGNAPPNICPVQQCSSTVNQGNDGQGHTFYGVNFKWSGYTPPPPPPGMHYLSSNITGCGGGTCSLFLEFNSTSVSSPSTPGPLVATLPTGLGVRTPIFVQTANGNWVPSYWSTVPNDVLANYGPLSAASSLPTLPYGFGSDRQPIYNQDGQRSYWSTVPDDVLSNYGPLSDASTLPTPTGTPASLGPNAGGQQAGDSSGNTGGQQGTANSPNAGTQQAGDSSGNTGGQQGTANSPNAGTQQAGVSSGNTGGQQGTANSPNAGTQQADTGNTGGQRMGDNSPTPSNQQGGNTYTPGSWDDPNCVAGCYDPKVLNDIGISPQFANGSPATQQPPANTQPSLAQLQAQVDQNRNLVAQQIAASQNVQPTTPPDTQLGSIFGLTACGSDHCYGGSAVIDSNGIHYYGIDPNNSRGNPQFSVFGQVAINPNSVAGGDSVTTTVPWLFGGGTSGTISGGGAAYGVSYGTPGVSWTRGIPLGTVPPPTTGTPGGRYQIITNPNGNIWGQTPSGATP
jgi:hypothetical protein